MKKIFSFTIMGGILIMLLAILVLTGQDGCENVLIRSPQGNEPRTRMPNGAGGVQIIVYQKGKETKLDPKNPHFLELQTIIEERLISANNEYQRLDSPQSALQLTNKNGGVEVVYSEPKEFSIAYNQQIIKPNRLLIPLTEDNTTIIYYAYSNQDYSSGPYINTKDVNEIRTILQSMGIEIGQEPSQSDNYTLTLHVTNLTGTVSISSVPIEVIRRDDHKIVAKSETDKNGIVIFNLSAGFYYCQVAEGINYHGKVSVNLERDTELELKTFLSPPH